MNEPGSPADPKLRLYQRLVGVAVLVAVAVVAVPLIFDFRGPDEPPIANSGIPAKPEGLRVEEITLRPAAPSAPATGRGATAVVPSASTAEPPAAAGNKVGQPPQAWAVKVGSFSSEDNATSLRNQLRSKGYSAFFDKTVVDGKPLLRVYVGPDVQKGRSEQLRERIAREFNLPEAVVVGYD
jgi:DedD protein